MMHSLHRLYFDIQKRLEHVLLSDQGLSFSQFMIVTGFTLKKDSSHHITQAKLAECLYLSEVTVSRHISTLVKKKFLTKVKDTANKKSYQISVTPNGVLAYEKAKCTITKELDDYFSPISKANQKMIIHNFTNVIVSLQQKK